MLMMVFLCTDLTKNLSSAFWGDASPKYTWLGLEFDDKKKVRCVKFFQHDDDEFSTTDANIQAMDDYRE